MKKALLLAAGLAFLAAPALAQQSPTGQSSGGPARMGNPGEGASTGTPMMGKKKMMKKKMKKKKMM